MGRLLKWEKRYENSENDWFACCKTGGYSLSWNPLARKCSLDHDYEDEGFDLTGADIASVDTMMDRAEADYLSRISEFVPVLKPGQVTIPLELAQDIYEALFGFAADLMLNRKIESGKRVCKLFEALKSCAPTPASDAETEDKAGGKTDD